MLRNNMERKKESKLIKKVGIKDFIIGATIFSIIYLGINTFGYFLTRDYLKSPETMWLCSKKDKIEECQQSIAFPEKYIFPSVANLCEDYLKNKK